MAPRIVLCTLNARYIHASLGLRCLLANLDRHGGAGLRAQAVLREYTVARPTHELLADLLHLLGDEPQGPGQTSQVLGLGVYIWNVVATTELLRLVKLARPQLRVVLGGPEVSHETDGQAIVALADHVITGWGEVSFACLCRDLLQGGQPQPKIMAGVQPELAQLELPYGEYTGADLAHRLLYVEASRGCPFHCAFCLSALDKTAWAFDLTQVLAALEVLYQRGARHFKFVDRTFNLRRDNALRILQFFLDKQASGAPGQPVSLHFEVVPDRLDQRLREHLAQFAPGVLQLEMGVQSFNPQVQRNISRRQDDEATAFNMRWLLAHSHAHLHADLVFGLPGESLQSFAEGFDRLLAIGPQEIQLGILKRLRGAPMTRHDQTHGTVYASQPPYQVTQTALIDAASMQRFVRFARYWDLLANSGRFVLTLSLLLATGDPATVPQAVVAGGGPDAATGARAGSAFWRFMDFSDWLWQQLGSTHQLTPERLVDALFGYLCQVLPLQTVRQALLADYVSSGARASPQALRGWLPRMTDGTGTVASTLKARQHRHSR
ncbi:MAG: radical SAM protein [Rhodoferax sp.]|uniref:B12-binding domain-containing radical SAM protein n=1 Tax=Rhodoferax sp. TaxID=50421 RepID=UPI001B7623BB|nr:radical SAM protein [Rhodoferax sp.]MBP9904853.1 radical SAM protein [Rhodoferax sp.]